MRRGRKTTAAGPAGLVGRRLRRIAPLALLLLAMGCVPEPAFDNDPLVGGRPLPRNGPPPTSPYNPVAAAPAPSGGPLQLPPPTGPVSPAALAGSPSAADASSLRIGMPPGNAGTPGALTSGPTVGGDAWHGAAPNGGATLKAPEPITDGSVKPIAVIAPPTPLGPPPPAVSGSPPAAATVDPYGQVQDLLTQRGVVFQSLVGPDEQGAWRFRCGVPSRDMPGSTHEIEVTAPGDRGLAAMRAVIAQIDQYQRTGR